MSSIAWDTIRDPDRLEALNRTGLLDTAPEEAFDRLTRLAATILRAPLALVNLIDAERQFSKSCFAPPSWPTERNTPLEQTFSTHVVFSREPLIIEDAERDPRAAFSNVVTDLGVRSYLGVPLVTADDHVLGTLCVADFQPRTWSEQDISVLRDLADSVMTEIQLRASLREVEEAEQLAAQLRESEERYRVLAETAADAIITLDEDSVIVYANPAAETTFGYSVEELSGMSMTELIPERFRAAHRAGMIRYLQTGERHIPWRGLELPGLHRSGREILLEVVFAERKAGDRHYFTGTMSDITERKRAERDRAVQHAVTRVLAESRTVDESLPRILRSMGESLGWDMGVFWSVDEEAEALHAEEIWATPSLQHRELAEVSRGRTFTRGVGLPGRVWAGGEPVWITDVTQDSSFPRLEVAARAGVHSAFAFPIQIGAEFVGVIEFFTCQVTEPDEALLATLHSLGGDIGQFIKRRQAEERLRRSEEVQHFLVQVSTVLAASVLDYNTTLRNLARLAVPMLGDWCSIYLLQDNGEIERVEIAHSDPAKAPLARKLERYPVDTRPTHPAMRVLQTGEPLLIPEIPEALIEAVSQDEDHLHLIQELGLRSAIVVPLIARGRTLGVATLVSSNPAHRYGERDLELAQEFARRGAFAVDNARLYRESQQANQAKSDFLATISHELRTPLNAVIGYSDLLSMEISENVPTTAEKYAERIGLSARHLNRLIEEVLTFANLGSGRERATLEPVDLHEVAREVEVIMEPLVKEKGLRFVGEIAAEPIPLETDPRKLRQVLLNLLDNAVKFTRQGEVGCRIQAEDDQVVFEIWDTGIGIAPEHREKIFDTFWQVEQSTTRTVGGTGVGLSVTRQLVELLRGSIEVESTPGEGSTFRVRLPLRGGGSSADPS